MPIRALVTNNLTFAPPGRTWKIKQIALYLKPKSRDLEL